MYCVSEADQGGESLLASSVYLHDVIQKERPDLLQCLYEPFNYSFPEWELSDDSNATCPVFSSYSGYVSSHYIRGRIKLFSDEVRRCRQLEALNYLDNLLDSGDYNISFLLKKGDILFFNNLTNYHSRTEFFDSSKNGKVRKIYRVWLSDKQSRPLSSDLNSFYTEQEDGTRGGVKPYL